MPAHRWGTRVLTTVGICLPLTAAVGEAQTTYTYTVIADVTNCYNIGSPALNSSGQVAFGARCGPPLVPSGEVIAIFRGEGGPVTSIYSWSPDSGSYHAPQTDVLSMNDAGVVAFAVNGNCPNGGGPAIWTSSGGSPAIVHDICVQPGFTSVLRPSISNSGAVAFWAASEQGDNTVVRVKKGALVTIAGPGSPDPTLGSLTGAFEPSINNHDVVTFMGQGELNYGLFTGAGGPLTLISTDGPPSVFNAISDDGRVAFVAGTHMIQTGDGGPVTVIASTTSQGGMYQSFSGGGAAISANGRVAFMAYTQSGALGVFTGPDSDMHKVLESGDVIAGLGIVRSVSILREAINDSGQVAILAEFDDEGSRRIAIIRADPPNTPPTAADGSTSVASGASVSGTLSASDPDGEPLTYAIVANGSKGTAVIDDPSSGAFTYSALAGTSGGDTFTFQVTDVRGLASNVATMTVDIEGLTTCAEDVSSSFAPAKGKGSKSSGTTHNLALTNVSDSPIAGPISVALDALSPAGTTLVNAVGVTSCSAPAGRPYVNVDVGADAVWSPGERVTVVLEFAVGASGRGKKPAITYTWRVLAGAGNR